MPSALQDPPAAPRSLPQRARAAFGRIPPQMRVLLGFLLLFAVAFSVTVLPLFFSSRELRAEVAGSVPSEAVAGQAMFLDLAIDNVGDHAITPICIAADFSLPVTVTTVVFQGLDRVPYKGDRACGGTLAGQETVSLRMEVIPRQAGSMDVHLVAGKGESDIGPVVVRQVEVRAP